MTKPVTDKDRHPHLSPEDAKTLKANYARVRKIRRDVKAKADAARADAIRASSTRAATIAATEGDSPFEIGSLDDLLKWENVLKAKKDNVIKLIEINSANTKLDTERGKLVPAEKVNEDQRQMCAAFAQALSALVDLVSLWVAPDKIIQAQAAFRDLAESKLYELSKDAE